MKISLIFKWFDFWIGIFYDRHKKWIYIFPVPMCGILIKLKEYKEFIHPPVLEETIKIQKAINQIEYTNRIPIDYVKRDAVNQLAKLLLEKNAIKFEYQKCYKYPECRILTAKLFYIDKDIK